MKGEYEYASLRTEIFYWQNFRFVLLAASITLLSGIIGFGVKNPDQSQLWVNSSCMLLLFLTAAVILSWYAGRGNAKIGAYLIVFYEDPVEKNPQQYQGWEDRQGRFLENMNLPQRAFDWLKLSHLLGAIYLLLGTISVVLPWFAGKQPWPPTQHHWIWIGGPAALFLGANDPLNLFLVSTRSLQGVLA